MSTKAALAAVAPVESTEEFADRMVDMLNGAAVTLMASIGHRTGLFDVMARIPPGTSADIAAAANLNERYVREWLGAMVTGRIVEYSPEDCTYHLPAARAGALTRAAAGDNVAVFSQWIGVLADVEDRVVDCFRNGGGVHYCEYSRFHEVMAEESGLTVVSALVESILPLVPGLVADMAAGIDVLDVGCGSGRALIHMACAFPASRFTGYDFSEEAVARARKEARRLGLENVRFEIRDAARLDEEQRYDLITAFDAIHDQKEPAQVLAGIARALRPDGTFLMQDIAVSSEVHRNMEHPIGPLIYTISCMHCMTVSLAQEGAGLGAAWGKELALQMLDEAGFAQVRVEQLPHDFQNCYYVAGSA